MVRERRELTGRRPPQHQLLRGQKSWTYCSAKRRSVDACDGHKDVKVMELHFERPKLNDLSREPIQALFVPLEKNLGPSSAPVNH